MAQKKMHFDDDRFHVINLEPFRDVLNVSSRALNIGL